MIIIYEILFRLDNNFIFNLLIEENLNRWLKPNNRYSFNNIIFKDHLNYIQLYYNKYNSNKCKNILYEYLKNSGMHKKWHKNNIKYRYKMDKLDLNTIIK